MKETNMEHFRSEIEEIIESTNEPPCLIDGKLQKCNGGMPCDECEFDSVGSCATEFIKWAMSEYKPEPVLTAREKHFVEFAETGWIARDKNGEICLYLGKPTKQRGTNFWDDDGEPIISPCFIENLFPFITWEDEEPWSVESLRKLKVADD